jgi:hypothetical protein
MDTNTPTPETTSTVQDPSMHTVQRPYGGIDGLREIRDSAGRLMVTVVPPGMASRFPVVRESLAACYVVVGQGRIDIGQSRWVGNASLQHAAAPATSVAGEVYIIHAQRNDWLFRVALPFLEFRLTELAREAGLVEVSNGASPRTWSSEDRALFERFVGESRRLLFDAGCRAFNTTPASQLPATAEADRGIDLAEEAPAQIDVDAVPTVGGELALPYAGLWARGYYGPDGFIVLPGSEVRTPVTMKKLREQLAEILVPIPGIDDRLRLEAAVCFRSAAIAAKFLTGAKMGGTKWVRPPYAEQIMFAE